MTLIADIPQSKVFFILKSAFCGGVFDIIKSYSNELSNKILFKVSSNKAGSKKSMTSCFDRPLYFL